mmetsp:Transcript_5895/g.7951  ORF Transcript_5895/g.7951 Transcript_5895/m.7951 type:complete len:521 (+) Transcript_5895:39-1601(+)|eukprot:CAMPEP_0196595450 /NCGR_PEP_ID=MMETSP1081-20130531/81156_1 /TAXON_ID=36882 /ORGANISM="Pyramimonas amylifera, Strain CCMP720" /LENGTH=520 /DNA_ID=CAMNT_0041920029 /DNA_START=32 /DNA_END=1594 /DNA_ORIENTATION=+
MSPQPARPGSKTNSVASSAKSTRSTYKVVAKTSQVDESLFGNNKPGATGHRGKSQVEVIDASRYLKNDGGQLETDVVTLPFTEVLRMREEAVILTDEDIRRMKEQAAREKEKSRAVSIARKDKMLKMEEERKKRVPPSETEKLKNEKDQGTLSKAQFMLEEELDDVKHMNQMLLYSKCVTIRDAQIEEKKYVMDEEEEEERRLDLMMEIERIKALEAYEEREQKRAADRLRGASVLKKQIEERALERQRQEELRDQDRKQMFAELERMKEEELQQQYEKRIAGQKLLQEVARANSNQIDRKKMIIQAEKEEDGRIARYIKEREAREQAAQEEQERFKQERELEVARLRAMQEKAADKQAELDELRAIRAQEAYEREWREKERAEAERKLAINADLTAARTQQKNVKVKQLADLARMEQEDFYRVIAAQREQEEMERQQSIQSSQIRKHHKEEILNQIAQNEECRKKDRQEHLEEGEKLRQRHKDEKNRLGTIKNRKLGELKEMGVPSKYRAELQRYKIVD